ncbi:MAG: hypothetical protein ACJAYU_000899 [Bradymonadia bacterium]
MILVTAMMTCGILVALNKVSAQQDRDVEILTTEEIAASVPSGQALTLLAMGHNEAMADLLWLNALSFYGRYRIINDDVEWLDPHINAIVEVDPKFRRVYEWAGAVIMYGGVINNESVMATNRVLERGVERFPYDWSLRMMLGINYVYELIPRTRAELELETEWRRYGTEQLAVGAGLPNAPETLRLASTSMLRRRAGWERIARSLEEVYLMTAADEARTIRSHIHSHLLQADGAALLRHREAMLALDRSSNWGFDETDLTLYLNPEPLLQFEPDELEPPIFALTR